MKSLSVLQSDGVTHTCTLVHYVFGMQKKCVCIERSFSIITVHKYSAHTCNYIIIILIYTI